MLFISVGLIYSQTVTVKGKVVDEAGMEVIGASVVVKGTTTGVATNVDGEFTLNVPENSTLVFSLVGMKKVEMKAAPNMKVVMENDEAILEEVIVTAMGITREKKALGYASQGIKSDELVQASNTSLSGALQGKVSGVQITPSSGMPGASSQITIRGARSFSGNNTPLYVIDGMPVASTADISTGNSVTGADYANRGVDIDPADIESIEILKGQSASALYGIRASNGVVVITTKSGKGLAKGKPQITVSSSVSFEKPTRYPKKQTLYAQGSEGVYNPTNSNSWGPLITELPNDPTYGGNTENEYTKEYGKQPGKYYVPQRAQAGLDPWATPQSYDNLKEFFNTGVTFNNSVSVAQAFDRSSYSLFLGMANQDGIVPHTGMDRYNVKLTAETQLAANWKTGFNGNFSNSSIQKAPTANHGILSTLYNSPSSYDLKGIPSNTEDDPTTQIHYRSGFDNPYWGMKNNEFKEDNNRFFGNAFVNYNTKFGTTDKKLDVKYQLGVDAYTTNYRDSFAYGSRFSAGGAGEITESKYSNTTFNSLLTANFSWNIDDNWTVNAIAGNEIVHENYRYLDAYGTGYTVPGWNHINNATITANSETDRSQRTFGVFGDISASYKNMVYLGVTGRNDIVSHMPRNNRSFFYPSVNASFVLTELPGLQNRKVFDFAKIRASYAEVGQAGDYRLSYFYKPSYGGGFYTGQPIIYPIGGEVNSYVPYFKVYDPALKPQNTRSYEVGADATLLNGLFDLSYTYSRQNVKDQIFDIPLPGSTGIQSMIANGGSIHTNTHELTVNVNPVRTKMVDWSIGANWTKIDNYVDELAEGVDNIFLGGFVTPQVRAGIGYKFPVIYGSSYARNDQGQIIVGEDGLPKTGGDGVIGDVSPDFILGFNTQLRIGKVNIAAVFDWKKGGQMYHGTTGVFDLFGVSAKTANRDQNIVVDGVKEDGSKNDIEVLPQDYYLAINDIDESSIYNNGFLKLRELSVSMTAYKTSWIEIGVNVFARNILLWSELENFDPESSQGNTNMSGAFERFSLPQTSSYGFGVNVKF